MSPDDLKILHIIVSVMTLCASLLLSFMFYNAALTNGHAFTRKFLQFLAASGVFKAVAIACTTYRSSQIEGPDVLASAALVGIAGRGLELLGYTLLIWFLLRPETKKALNGAQPST